MPKDTQDFLKQKEKLKYVNSNSAYKKSIDADAMIKQLIANENTFKVNKTHESPDSYNTYSIPDWLNVKNESAPVVYRKIWNKVRSSSTSQFCDTNSVSQLFITSGLPLETLAYLWAIGNSMSPGSLTQQELYIMLAFIALIQDGYPVSSITTKLEHLKEPRIPNLDYTLLDRSTVAKVDLVLPRPCYLNSTDKHPSPGNGVSLYQNGVSTPGITPKLNIGNGQNVIVQNATSMLPPIDVSNTKTTSHSGFDSNRLHHLNSSFKNTVFSSGFCVSNLPVLCGNVSNTSNVINDADPSTILVTNIKTPTTDVFNNFSSNTSTISDNSLSCSQSIISSVPPIWSVSLAPDYMPSNSFRTTNSILDTSPCISPAKCSKLNVTNLNNTDYCSKPVSQNHCSINASESQSSDDEFTEFQSAIPNDEFAHFQTAVQINECLIPGNESTLHNSFQSGINNDQFQSDRSHFNSGIEIVVSDNLEIDRFDSDFGSPVSDAISTVSNFGTHLNGDNCNQIQLFDTLKNITEDSQNLVNDIKEDIGSDTKPNDVNSDASSIDTLNFDPIKVYDSESISDRLTDLSLYSDTVIQLEKITENNLHCDGSASQAMFYNTAQKSTESFSFDHNVNNMSPRSLTDDIQNSGISVDNISLQLEQSYPANNWKFDCRISEPNTSSITLHHSQDFTEDKYDVFRSLSSNVVFDQQDNSEDDEFGDFVTADQKHSESINNPVEETVQDKCLNACLRLLEEGSSIFGNIDNECILKHVLSHERGYAYFKQLKIVYETSQRFCKHFGNPAMVVKLAELWNGILKYSKHIPSHLKEISDEVLLKDSNIVENIDICSLCKTECFTGLAHYQNLPFHITCVNLYLNFVDDAELSAMIIN